MSAGLPTGTLVPSLIIRCTSVCPDHVPDKNNDALKPTNNPAIVASLAVIRSVILLGQCARYNGTGFSGVLSMIAMQGVCE